MTFDLWAPDSYRNAPADEIARVVNGCGPGAWKFDFVPDHIFHHNIRPACNIHDWCYYIGGTEEDRAFYDLMLHNNIIRCIMNDGGTITAADLAIADQYFLCVRNFGAKYFGVN